MGCKIHIHGRKQRRAFSDFPQRDDINSGIERRLGYGIRHPTLGSSRLTAKWQLPFLMDSWWSSNGFWQCLGYARHLATLSDHHLTESGI